MDKLSEHDIMLRKKHFNMTDGQAKRLPGWHVARHRDDSGKWYLIEENRDDTGQLIGRRSVKKYNVIN